jgi:5-methylcytosine-specific restriction endonuclease McrA
MKEYDITQVIHLRDEQKLKWKEIEEIIGVSSETLRKAYKRTKEGKTSHEANPNSYEAQKARALKRKLYFIEKLGGKCCKCGYHKNISALEFHHLDPSEKEFGADARHLSNTSMEKLEREIEKCILVCANCHREIHHPDLSS